MAPILLYIVHTFTFLPVSYLTFLFLTHSPMLTRLHSLCERFLSQHVLDINSFTATAPVPAPVPPALPPMPPPLLLLPQPHHLHHHHHHHHHHRKCARLSISLLPSSILPSPPLAAASRCGAPNFSSFIFEKKSENAATRNTQHATRNTQHATRIAQHTLRNTFCATHFVQKGCNTTRVT